MAMIDVERLFRQFTIAEIKDVEKKIKTDIEKKKEDLRQMVGRRYQDIIEAADSITEMKNYSELILDSLRCVQMRLTPLDEMQAKSARYKGSMSKSEPIQREPIILMKLLNDLPELIWDCLDNKLYLDAAWIYNFADYVYKILGIRQGISINEQCIEMPYKIIRRQLVEIDEAIQHSLNTADACEHDVELDALCAAVLLKNLSISDALNLFLYGKERALKSLFNDSEISGRVQICKILRYFQNCIFTLAKLLNLDPRYLDCHQKSLFDRIQEINDSVFQIDVLTDYLKIQSSRTCAALKLEIENFHCNVCVSEIDNESLRKTCSDWLSRCIKSCREKVSDCLSYFGSIESLSALQSGIQDIIMKSNNELWDSACEHLFGKKLSLWDTLIAEFLQTQLKELVLKQVNDHMAQFERRLEKYISSEASKTAFESTNFLFCSKEVSPPHKSSHGCDNGLHLKSLGIPPDLFTMVSELNSDIEKLKTDLEAFLNVLGSKAQANQQAVEFYLDPTDIRALLASNLKCLLEKFIVNLNESPRDAGCLTTCTGWLFIAKICACFIDSTPVVKQILIEGHYGSSSWSEITERLKSAMMQSYNAALCQKVDELSKLHLSLDSMRQADFWLLNLLDWSSVEITDELDDGRKISSTISVPMFISPYLSDLLNDLCRFLCNIGPLDMPRESIVRANRALLSEVSRFYNNALDTTSTDDQIKTDFFGQKQAIQCIFDLKFLDALLDRKESSADEKGPNENRVNLDVEFSRLISKIESRIDPFDLDTLYPHLKRNGIKLLMKCQAVYGLLLTPEAAANLQHLQAVLKKEESSQQLSNVLDSWHILKMCPESSLQTRFRMLPAYDDAQKYDVDAGALTELTRNTSPSDLSRNSSAAALSFNQIYQLDTPKLGSIPTSLSSIYDKFSSSLFGHHENT